MTSTIFSRGVANTEEYVEQVRKQTQLYKPWFTHLQWAQHMIAYGIVSLIFALDPIFTELPWLRAICTSSGMIFFLIGLKRYLFYFAQIIRAKLAPYLKRP